MIRVWMIVGIGIAVLAAIVFWLAGERPDVLAVEDNQIRLTYLLLLLVLVGSGLIVRWRDRPKLKWLRHGLIWAALGLVLIVGYSYRTEVTSLWTRTLAELMPGRAIEVTTGTAMVRAGEDSHFRIDGTVDGARIRFLLDTGASMVVLNRRDALKVGFDLDRLAFTQRTQTANGVGMGAPVTLREIRIGPIIVKNIRAMVNKTPMSTSLLGVNFLDRLSGYSVKNGTLTLRQ
jgi:aspartyl protease family protein